MNGRGEKTIHFWHRKRRQVKAYVSAWTTCD